MNLPITILTNFLINLYFDKRCVLLLQDSDNISIHNFATIQIRPQNLTDVVYTDSERCLGFVLENNKPLEILESIEKRLRRAPGRSRYNDRKYIIFLKKNIFVDGVDPGVLDYIVDVLFVVEFDEYFQFFTHKYGGLDGSNEFITLDVWFVGNESFLFNANLFPDKLKEQGGRKFRIGALNFRPYSLVEERKGTELILMLEYSKKCNMTAMISNEKDIRGGIFPNGTRYGAFGRVINDERDIGLGGILVNPIKLQYSDFTHATVQTGITYLVPLPRIQSGWLTQISAFDENIWLLFLSSYVIIVLCAYVSASIKLSASDRFSGKGNVVLNRIILSTFARFTTQGLDFPKTYTSASSRFLSVIALILSLLFSTIYSSRLASSMVKPSFSDDINTIADLANSKIDVLSFYFKFKLFPDTPELLKYIYEKQKLISWTELRARSKDGICGFAIGRLPSGYFAVADYIQPDVIHKYKVMKEDLVKHYTAIQLRKNSVLLSSLNMFLLRCAAAGLVIHWEAEASRLVPNINVQRRILYPSGKKVVSLKLSDIQGAFVLWTFCILIAITRFVYEMKSTFKCTL